MFSHPQIWTDPIGYYSVVADAGFAVMSGEFAQLRKAVGRAWLQTGVYFLQGDFLKLVASYREPTFALSRLLLKALDTFGYCQRPVFSLTLSISTSCITFKKNCENLNSWASKLRENNGKSLSAQVVCLQMP